jgi:hypothetical protein
LEELSDVRLGTLSPSIAMFALPPKVDI